MDKPVTKPSVNASSANKSGNLSNLSADQAEESQENNLLRTGVKAIERRLSKHKGEKHG